MSRPHSDRRVIFLDDGGVMNNNDLRAPQWQRLLGEFMPTRLGGRPDEWASANRAAYGGVLNEYGPRWDREPPSAFYDDYLFDWIRVMCERVGVSLPRREDAVAIAREANAYVTRRVHAAFPEVVDVVRQLHGNGCTLHTASGEYSRNLEGYLEAMRVRELFGKLYGPDLLDLPFRGPQYYERLFEDSSTTPQQAIVVDDSEHRIMWATEAGASGVLVRRDGGPPTSFQTISSLAQLPSLIEDL